MSQMPFIKLDDQLEELLRAIYVKFGDTSQLCISEPEYVKIEIDQLICYGLLKFHDATTLSGWKYIICPSYKGREYFKNLRKIRKNERKRLIFEVLKFLIPVLISIVALLVAILK